MKRFIDLKIGDYIYSCTNAYVSMTPGYGYDSLCVSKLLVKKIVRLPTFMYYHLEWEYNQKIMKWPMSQAYLEQKSYCNFHCNKEDVHEIVKNSLEGDKILLCKANTLLEKMTYINKIRHKWEMLKKIQYL